LQLYRCALNEAGIYVIVGLAHDCPTCAVTRDAAPDCYPNELKTQGQEVINAFAKYPNTLAFSAGNEVNHFVPPGMPEWNGPCQKKFLRDMRAYMDSCETLRNVPIGLVSADNEREETAEFYNCRTDPTDEYENAEWYGINAYVFCDGAAKKYSDALGLKILEESFQSMNYSIPVVMTEFGCLSETFANISGFENQRNFLSAKWLLEEPTLRDQFSGGVVFEYSIEMENAKTESPYPFHKFGHQNYGVGYYGPEHCDDVNIPCAYHPMPSYDMLKEHYTKSKVSKLANLMDFEADPYRMEPSQCPRRFPLLSDFVWEADKMADVRCPAAGQASNYVCPAGKPKIHAVPLDGHKTPEKHTHWFPWVLALLLISAFISILYAHKHDRRVSKWMAFPKSKKQLSDDDSSDSDESAGLLSMKSYQKDSKSVYSAIESDSSSEDLPKLGRITVAV
jgi:1,3-beta-glucanosyltransferase GAS5